MTLTRQMLVFIFSIQEEIEPVKTPCLNVGIVGFKGVSMISEQGIIEKVLDDKAVVRVQKSAACAHCKSKGSCNISERNMLIEVSNDIKASKGDYVEISVPEGTLLKLSVLVYLLPIIALTIGAFLGGFLANSLQTDSSLTPIVGGGVFLGIAFFGLIRFERRRRSDNNYKPRMTRIVANASFLQSDQ